MTENSKLYRYEYQDVFNDDGYVHTGFLIADSEDEALSVVAAEKNLHKQYIKVEEKRLIELD